MADQNYIEFPCLIYLWHGLKGIHSSTQQPYIVKNNSAWLIAQLSNHPSTIQIAQLHHTHTDT